MPDNYGRVQICCLGLGQGPRSISNTWRPVDNRTRRSPGSLYHTAFMHSFKFSIFTPGIRRLLLHGNYYDALCDKEIAAAVYIVPQAFSVITPTNDCRTFAVDFLNFPKVAMAGLCVWGLLLLAVAGGCGFLWRHNLPLCLEQQLCEQNKLTLYAVKSRYLGAQLMLS